MLRYTVHFSGRVQGVGFRYTAQRAAGAHAVAGFVENLEDGRVRLVAEGEAKVLDSFLQELHDQMAHYIRERAIEHGPATGEFGEPGKSSFQVRR